MATKQPAKKGAKDSAKGTASEASRGFTDAERAAMKERAKR
jgi:hypothetical protein